MEPHTVLWLFPAVFMLHDLEEIIMMRPWLARNRTRLRQLFNRPDVVPAILLRYLLFHENLSTSAFALAAAVEFAALSAFTAVAVELHTYSYWTGILIVFFLHLLVHIAQWLLFKRYVPTIITSIAGLFYCIPALRYAFVDLGVSPQALLPTTLSAGLVIILAFTLALTLASRFQLWLNQFGEQRSGPGPHHFL